MFKAAAQQGMAMCVRGRPLAKIDDMSSLLKGFLKGLAMLCASTAGLVKERICCGAGARSHAGLQMC